MIKHSLDSTLKQQAKKKLNKKTSNKNLIYKFNDLTIDISRNLIDMGILKNLQIFSKSINIKSKINQLFNNKHKSLSENKKVSFLYERFDKNITKKNFDKLFEFHDLIKKGNWKSASGKIFKYIVHIGIGGSILGPKATSHALKDYHDKKIQIYFASSADTSEIEDILEKCNLTETLFIFASKSFETREVLINYKYIKDKLSQFVKKPKDIQKNFLAITANKNNALKLGINPKRILIFPKTIPGRFSLSSSISFPLLLQIGKNNYNKFINGINKIDAHFKNSKVESNIPLMLALISIWNVNYKNITSNCILTYNHRLRSFSSFIQQLEMESNGKSVNDLNQKIDYNTSPFVFGLQGTECQHSIFQMLHQGTLKTSIDFIGVINTQLDKSTSNFLLSNLIAQADLSFDGKCESKLYKILNGKNPSTIILLERLNPQNLGSLIALYENKIVAEGLLWRINSFDQWGVEEGKTVSEKVLKKINSKLQPKNINEIIKVIRKKLD